MSDCGYCDREIKEPFHDDDPSPLHLCGQCAQDIRPPVAELVEVTAEGAKVQGRLRSALKQWQLRADAGRQFDEVGLARADDPEARLYQKYCASLKEKNE